MPNQPKTQHRSIRIPDDVWGAAMDRAREEGTSAGGLVRDLLVWWLRVPGAKLPRRPGVSRTDDGDQAGVLTP